VKTSPARLEKNRFVYAPSGSHSARAGQVEIQLDESRRALISGSPAPSLSQFARSLARTDISERAEPPSTDELRDYFFDVAEPAIGNPPKKPLETSTRPYAEVPRAPPARTICGKFKEESPDVVKHSASYRLLSGGFTLGMTPICAAFSAQDCHASTENMFYFKMAGFREPRASWPRLSI
jgi:hypothetical protein